MFRGIVLLAGIAVATNASAQQARSDLFSQQPSRYQIVINPQMRADTFLLDTATGKVWQLTKFDDLEDAPTAWRYMDRLDNGSQVMEWVAQKTPKKDDLGASDSKPRAHSKLKN